MSFPSPCLVVLAGPSGSGKSSWAEQRFLESEMVSSDRLRGMVGAGPEDQTAGTPAFALLDQIVEERLRRRLTTVVDTVGTDPARRERWIDLARSADVPAHAVVFDTDLETCFARNRERSFPTPQAVVRRQHSDLQEQIAGLRDEFDEVHIVGSESEPDTVISADDEPERSAPVGGGHTFGLLISRFNWIEGPFAAALSDVAVRAEKAGFRDIWLMDHFRQIPQVGRAWEDIPEAYVTLAYLAAKTTTIRLGVLVSGITHRHPAVVGQMIATLDVLSHGRAVCGLGVGWDRDEHRALGIPFPETPERYSLLEDALRLLPMLWGPGTPAFEGNVITAEALTCYPRPLQERIPIMVGGSGERRTLRLVAELADACNVFGDPDRVRHKVEVLREHCREVGRDPLEIEKSHLLTAMTAAERGELLDRADSLRGRNTPAETYLAKAGGMVAEDMIELIRRYDDAGAGHTIVALPDVGLPGSIESFAPVIAALSGQHPHSS